MTNDDVWNALSCLVFIALFAIAWRGIYNKAIKGVKEAFDAAEAADKAKAKAEAAADPEPLKTLINAALLRSDKQGREPPYSIFALLAAIVMIILWLLFYTLLLFVGARLFDYLIVSNTMRDGAESSPNYVHIVLTKFLVTKTAFIVHACLMVAAVVTVMYIVLAFVFPDMLLEREMVETLVKSVMFMLLLTVPVTYLTRAAKRLIASWLASRIDSKAAHGPGEIPLAKGV